MKKGKTTNYNHISIEKKWQKYWAKNKIYKTSEKADKPKCYVLDMFPYPSGEGLHVGHPRGYIATDIYSRLKRMKGFNVLHPMGWDAFGLPAEQYAIKTKTNPVASVAKNIKRYKEQLSIIGLSYDWEREISTADPKYYKWTQWIFLQLFKNGLAYESFEPINWCPSCKTGLANEDLEDGRCERCDSVIEKKPMRQWVLKIRDYADKLLSDLDELTWPVSIKESQKNWIGRSEGAEITFKLKDINKEIKVFTTRPDTLFGLSYVVIAPENKLITELRPQIKNWKEIENYINEIKNRTEIERTAEGKEKTGVKLEGIKAINPVNREEVPVFIADYVLANYGTGSVMAVPAHDKRDFAFAKKYNLPMKEVISPLAKTTAGPDAVKQELPMSQRSTIVCVVKHWSEDKYLCLSWKKYSWKTFIVGGTDGEDPVTAGLREITEETGYTSAKFIKRLGGELHNQFFASHKGENRWAVITPLYFELQNSQQINISDDEKNTHDVVWVERNKVKDFIFDDKSDQMIWDRFLGNETPYVDYGILVNSGQFDGMKSEEAKRKITEFAGGKMTVTYKLQNWVFSRQRYWGEPIPVIHCEKCGVVAVPEKELPLLLPKVKSYEPTGTGESPLASISKWVNVKCPKCGEKAKRETNTMPQWAGSSWYYLRYIDPKNDKAIVDPKKEKYWTPVDMYVGGTEHATRHLIYARFWHKFLFDIGAVSTKEPFKQLRNQGMVLGSDGRKMGKRWGNVVNPDDVVKNVGADTLRVYESFMGPFGQEISWSTDSMVGSRRFLDRVWKLQDKVADKFNDNDEVILLLNQTIKKIGEDIESFGMNTAVSSMMILSNTLESQEQISKEAYLTLIKLLSPFAPHMCEEIWQKFGGKKTILNEGWPKYDESKLQSSQVKIVVQINGKVRGTIDVATDSLEDVVEKVALKNTDIVKWMENMKITKRIFVKNKIINFVVQSQ